MADDWFAKNAPTGDDWFAKNAPPTSPDQLSQFGSTLGNDLLNLPGNIYSMVRHPIDSALAASADQRVKAAQDFRSGNYLDAVTHGIGGYAPIPFLPPFLADTLTDIGSKENMGRGAARLAEMGAGAAIPPVVRGMEMPSSIHPIARFVAERGLGIPHGSLSAMEKLTGVLRGKGEISPAALGQGDTTGPYFNERSTLDPGMHGPITPVSPLNPAPLFSESGTVVPGTIPPVMPKPPVTPKLIPPVAGPGNIQGIEDFNQNRAAIAPADVHSHSVAANAEIKNAAMARRFAAMPTAQVAAMPDADFIGHLKAEGFRPPPKSAGTSLSSSRPLSQVRSDVIDVLKKLRNEQ